MNFLNEEIEYNSVLEGLAGQLLELMSTILLKHEFIEIMTYGVYPFLFGLQNYLLLSQ